MRRYRILIFLTGLLVLGSCKPDKSTTSTLASAENAIRIAIREPTSLDPAFLNGNTDFQIAVNVHSGLFIWDSDSDKVVPFLATDFHAEMDSRVWIINIDRKARFSDGTPITAQDFVFAWRRILDPATASPGADALFWLKHGKSFAAGGTIPPAVTAVDDYTLRVELEHPQPFLPEILASPRFAPIPHQQLARPEDLFRTSPPASSGPYTIKEWSPRQHLILEPNPHHPAARSSRPVLLRFTSQEESALTWWDAGQVDLVVGLVPFPRIRHLKAQHGKEVVTQPMRSVFYLLINTTRAPFLEPAFRQALAAGPDRIALVTDILGAGQEPAAGFIPPLYRSIGFTPQPCRLLHPATARASIQDDWLSSAQGRELLCNSSDTLKTIMEFIQQNLQSSFGLFVSIRLLEWQSFLAELKKGTFDLARLSLTGGIDPVDFLDNFTHESSNNFGNFNDPDYDALIARIHSSGDLAERIRLMHRAHAMLCEAMPAIPVYFSSQVYLVRDPFLKSFKPTPEGAVIWSSL
jgi:oligopeptide transport system substrate-binding protein